MPYVYSCNIEYHTPTLKQIVKNDYKCTSCGNDLWHCENIMAMLLDEIEYLEEIISNTNGAKEDI